MSAPSPPNPYTQAAAQAGANRDAAIAGAIVNNPSKQITPWGTLVHRKAGSQWMTTLDEKGHRTQIKVPRFVTETKLNQNTQKTIANQQLAQRKLSRMAVDRTDFLKDYMGKSVDTSGLPQYVKNYKSANYQKVQRAPNLATDYAGFNNTENAFSRDRNRVEQAMMSRYDQQYGKDREAMRSELAGEGLMPGSEAYNNRLDELNRQRTDARMQAILAGGQEQSRLLGEARSAAEFGNEARQNQYGMNSSTTQANNAIASQKMADALQKAQYKGDTRQAMLSERTALRNQPLNEISALMSGSQVQTPQFEGLYRQGIDAAQPAKYMQDAYQSKLANYQSTMGGLFGLGSSMMGLFGLSDRTKKKNIKHEGYTPAGQKVYSYRYKKGWGDDKRHLGVMAQDLEKTNPEAVVTIDGVKHVDYSRVS